MFFPQIPFISKKSSLCERSAIYYSVTILSADLENFRFLCCTTFLTSELWASETVHFEILVKSSQYLLYPLAKRLTRYCLKIILFHYWSIFQKFIRQIEKWIYNPPIQSRLIKKNILKIFLQ